MAKLPVAFSVCKGVIEEIIVVFVEVAVLRIHGALVEGNTTVGEFSGNGADNST